MRILVYNIINGERGDFVTERLLVYESASFDPYYNLAVEKALFDSVDDFTGILYLWQNKDTVVIGKNQNAWEECRVSNMEADGVRLARRLSGGGAVYHDLGNLNFTFISSSENYSTDKNIEVIKKACSYAGIEAEKSGRNDLLVEGKKFSGNAFLNSHGHSYHHGTILINSDLERLSKYLSPKKEKFISKGVKSVKSRVANLIEFAPYITVDLMKKYLIRAFEEVYGKNAERMDIISDNIKVNESPFSDWDFVYGSSLPFEMSAGARFDWGGIDININVEKGVITSVKAYTDAMDPELAEKIESALSGVRFDCTKIESALDAKKIAVKGDILTLIKEQLMI